MLRAAGYIEKCRDRSETERCQSSRAAIGLQQIDESFVADDVAGRFGKRLSIRRLCFLPDKPVRGADIREPLLLIAKRAFMSDKPTWDVGEAPGPLLACPAGADVWLLANAC